MGVVDLDLAWAGATVMQRERFAQERVEEIATLAETASRRVKYEEIQALSEVKQICETAGCECEIVETKHAVLLTLKHSHRNYSLVLSLGSYWYQVRAGRTMRATLPRATAQEAADVLIWEKTHIGKRWWPGR